MRLAVDTGAYASATDLLYDANHGVTDAMSTLAGELSRCTAMSGTDAGGREWAAGYDQVATDLLRAGADLGGSMGASADLLDASLANHEGADHSALLHPEAVGTTSGGRRRGAERLSPAAVPSAFGGTGGEPEGWHWLAEHLEGMLWPDADTARMRSAGTAWLAGGHALDSWAWAATSASYAIEGQRSPEVPVAVRATRELGEHATELAAACRDLGSACHSYAEQVEAHHEEVVGVCRELLAWTAVDQVTGVVLSFVTGGGAELAAQLVQSGVMARYAARVVAILRRLVELARAAAGLITRGLLGIGRILDRLQVFLSLRTVRALERVGSTAAGRRVLAKLPHEVQEQVDDAIERAARGKIRFPGHDGKDFDNGDPLYRLPSGSYHEWTVAAARSTRGAYRVLIDGDPADPRAIYFWDHVRPPVRIGP